MFVITYEEPHIHTCTICIKNLRYKPLRFGLLAQTGVSSVIWDAVWCLIHPYETDKHDRGSVRALFFLDRHLKARWHLQPLSNGNRVLIWVSPYH